MALISPLLIRNPKTNKYTLNFDPFVVEVIQESDHMTKFGLEVPEFIKIVMLFKDKLFASYETMKHLVHINDTVR